MNTLLTDISKNLEATTLEDDHSSPSGVTTSTPTSGIDSKTFLQQQVFTGIEFIVPLPIGAENGFQPMFAVRVQPNTENPYIYTSDATLAPFAKDPEDGQLIYTPSQLQALPFRVFNGTTARFTGPESPNSVISKMYRFNRINFVYTLRLVSTYTGGGLIMVVPVKGVLRGLSPVVVSSAAQILANGMLVNSNIQCDLSKSRQLRFVYPYEYPTEYQDIMEDHVFSSQYDPTNAGDGSMPNFDNWFVVGTRGNIITPTNADKLTFYLDYAFGEYELKTPLLPSWRAVYPSVPMVTDGNKTLYAKFTPADFNDVVPPRPYTTTVFRNDSGSTIYLYYLTDGGATHVEHKMANGSSMTTSMDPRGCVYIALAEVADADMPTPTYVDPYTPVCVESGISVSRNGRDLNVSTDKTKFTNVETGVPDISIIIAS